MTTTRIKNDLKQLKECGIPFIHNITRPHKTYAGNFKLEHNELLCLVNMPEIGYFGVSFKYNSNYPREPFKMFFKNVIYVSRNGEMNLGGKFSHPIVDDTTGEIQLLTDVWVSLITPVMMISTITLMVSEPNFMDYNRKYEDISDFVNKMKFINIPNVCRVCDFGGFDF